MKRTRHLFSMAAAGALVAMSGSTAFATITIKLLDNSYNDTSGGGGEFNAIVSGANFIGNYNSKATIGEGANKGFSTFCIEYSEHIAYNTTYTAVINDGAMGGGVGGASNGEDRLSVGTAWLYSQFAKGVLAGYNYDTGNLRQTSSKQLQEAIWYLENEIPNTVGFGSTYDASVNPFLYGVNGVVNKFGGDLTKARANADPYANNVVVLNLYDGNRKMQDQLAIVPEPSTIMAGALLLLPFGASAVRILRKNREV